MTDRAAPEKEPDKKKGAPPADGPSDRSLLRRFQGGQRDAATVLYLRYADRLHRLAENQCAPDLAPRVDAEDIVQSVFRTFFRRAALGQYEVPRGEELWKLLLVIALNKIRATGLHHRAAKRDVRLTTAGALFDEALRVTAADEAALTVLRLVIDDVLQTLAPEQRPIIEQRIEGYEVAEIARNTRRSKRSVERILQEFRKRLRAVIHEDA
jgi:RNA polymerase sigma-70 factor (ECF subfamily)